MTSRRIGLVIFDCDGVLIDSEGPANRLLVAEANRLGWRLSSEDAMRRFVGMTIADVVRAFHDDTGGPAPDGWGAHLAARLLEAMRAEAVAIEGAAEVLRAVTAMGLPFRVASNSSHHEMRVKFARTGLDLLVAGRCHSAADVGRGKPAPDLFLSAAAAEGVSPGSCVVIEDSVPGTVAGVAAGMRVVVLAPDGRADAHLGRGASHVVRRLAELPALLATLALPEPVA